MGSKGVEQASACISLGIGTDSVPRQIESALNKASRIGADISGAIAAGQQTSYLPPIFE